MYEYLIFIQGFIDSHNFVYVYKLSLCFAMLYEEIAHLHIHYGVMMFDWQSDMRNRITVFFLWLDAGSDNKVAEVN